ncbi:MAG: HD domain-containing protein, partial [Elusimicrobiota bacterium]|nr:HD domain-containing protein [Elusimicrobiota bacterium]
MRLADILKKQKGVSVVTEKETVKEPTVEPTITTPIAQEIRELHSAEKVYGELIATAKNVYDNIETSQIAFLPIMTVIRKVIAVLVAGNDELVAFCECSTPELYLYSHAANVCILSTLLGVSMNYSQVDLEKLALSALLHDIGMLKLLNIANKPEKIPQNEFKEIKKHSYVSELLSNIELTGEQKQLLETIISQIHERIDGHGYPKGLSGEDINIFARIIGVADVYEALTHKRPWRDRYLPHEALKKMIEIADSDFDTKLIKLFIDKISLYPPGSYVRLNT